MDNEVIHCRGRINRASIPVTAKNPILLHPKHWFTVLIIKDHHELVHHNGIGETLNSVRGTQTVKKEVRRCVFRLRRGGKIVFDH